MDSPRGKLIFELMLFFNTTRHIFFVNFELRVCRCPIFVFRSKRYGAVSVDRLLVL